MSETVKKRNYENILTSGRITAAYFSTSGNVENKDWKSNRPPHSPDQDSGVFTDCSDEDQDSKRQESPLSLTSDSDLKPQNIINKTDKQSKKTTVQSQTNYRGMKIYKCDDKLSVISEKSCESASHQTLGSAQSRQTIKIENFPELPAPVQPEQPPRQDTAKSRRSTESKKSKKLVGKKKKKKVGVAQSHNRNVNLDIPEVYQRQNTMELLNSRDDPFPVARRSVNRKITSIRNNMYGNHLRESTKKLQEDLQQTMRKYSSEKTQLLQQLSSLRHQRNKMAEYKMNTPSSELSDLSSVRSNRSQSRYYMAPNLAAHKISKKKKKTQETKITPVAETPQRMREGILKLPMISPHRQQNPVKVASASSKAEWDSGHNNSMHNLPPLDPPPGIAAAQELLKDSYKIPKVQDSTRHDINRSTFGGNISRNKKKVHFAEKHSVSEYGHRDFHDFMVPKNSTPAGDTKSLPPLSTCDNYSVDSIKAYSALPPITTKNGDLNPTEVMRATQQYKSLYLKMKDPEQRMKTLAEILYSVRLKMIENEQTLKYGINPKHMKNASTLCDFLMNRNHNSSMSMNSELSTNDVKSRGGIPNNAAARSGRKSGSLQLQNYLRKMSKSRRPSEEIRLSRMMGQTDLSETQDRTSPQAVTY